MMAIRRVVPQHDEAMRPLLLEVAAGFAAKAIEARRIDWTDEPGEITHGAALPGGRVIIDEAVSQVIDGIHEVLHRIRPAWSESHIRRTTTRLVNGMTRAEIEALHTVYLSVRQARKTAAKL